jgi:hypothetical protein
MIKFYNIRFLYLFIFFSIFACSKSADSNQPVTPAVEEDIVYTIDIDPGSGIYSSLGSSQDMKVLISSKVPSGGVGVDMVVKKDSDGTTVSSSSISSSKSNSITLTITNLTGGSICTVNVTVRSLSKPANTLTRTFKIAKK